MHHVVVVIFDIVEYIQFIPLQKILVDKQKLQYLKNFRIFRILIVLKSRQLIQPPTFIVHNAQILEAVMDLTNKKYKIMQNTSK